MDPSDTPDGQQPEAVTQAGDSGTEPKGQPLEGVQRRIDELTRKIHETERLSQEKDAVIAELIHAQSQRQPAAQAPPEPEIDADRRKEIEAVLRPYTAKLEQLYGHISSQMGRQQLTSAISQVGDPEVEKLANALWNDWQKRGLDRQGFTAEEAVTYAVGMVAKKDRVKAAADRTSRARYNSGIEGPITGHSMVASDSSNGVPEDLNSWSPDKQVEYWTKRVGDKPF